MMLTDNEKFAIAEKICDKYTCESCPFELDGACSKAMDEVPRFRQHYDTVIDVWMKINHQKKRYPTWNEWYHENFSDAKNALSFCPNIFWPECRFDGKCQECLNSEIPAKIAEKLGIKPRIIKEENE